MTTASVETTVGQWVRERPARSRVLEKLGIDYCCGGKRPLREACEARGLDALTVAAMLDAVVEGGGAELVDAAAMSMTQLCDHIEATHHVVLRREMPRLQKLADKVAEAHRERYPRLRELGEIVTHSWAELQSHMMKEEQVLFPALRQMDKGQHGSVCFESVRQPIAVMEAEHDGAGHAFGLMREMTHDWSVPSDGCNTWRALVDGLREVEADTHQHIHKENNVLFPKAIEAEDRMRTGRSS